MITLRCRFYEIPGPPSQTRRNASSWLAGVAREFAFVTSILKFGKSLVTESLGVYPEGGGRRHSWQLCFTDTETFYVATV